MSPSQCQKLCNKVQNCFYWTYNQRTKLCYLKEDITNWQKMYGERIDTVSGPRRCCFNAGQAYKKGFATDEGNRENATGYMECQQKCQRNSQCILFTFIHPKCYLKKANPGINKNDKAISGPKYCPEEGSLLFIRQYSSLYIYSLFLLLIILIGSSVEPEWSEWGACSVTCGNSGKRRRTKCNYQNQVAKYEN